MRKAILISITALAMGGVGCASIPFENIDAIGGIINTAGEIYCKIMPCGEEPADEDDADT